MIVPVSANTTGINILVYGDNGSGKTPLAGTAPNCLILDADNGTESAAMHDSSAVKWPMRNWNDMEDAYEYLRHEDHGFEWVWLDSVSTWLEHGLEHIMEDLVAIKSHRKVWAADKGEYGQNMSRTKTWVRHMVAQPFNFGITAHVFRGEDEIDNESIILPWIRGKGMPSTISGYMSVVAYMERSAANPNNTYLYTSKFGDHKLIRDRYNCLADDPDKSKHRIKNPTIPQITEMIERAKAPKLLKKRRKKQ